MLPIHTILHPTDFSERSEFAFRMASSLARDYGARLIVLHVWCRPMLLYGELEPVVDSDEYRIQAQNQLDRFESHDSGIRMERRLLEGDAVPTILREAEDEGADLIVMGMHGRTGLSRLLMGSTAEHVVRRASCPVLTVKTPFPAAADHLDLRVEEPVAVAGEPQLAMVG